MFIDPAAERTVKDILRATDAGNIRQAQTFLQLCPRKKKPAVSKLIGWIMLGAAELRFEGHTPTPEEWVEVGELTAQEWELDLKAVTLTIELLTGQRLRVNKQEQETMGPIGLYIILTLLHQGDDTWETYGIVIDHLRERSYARQ